MKEHEIDKVDLLYNEMILEQLFEEYGSATDIKRNVETDAFIYEIHTAINYWLDRSMDGRTSDAVMKRLRIHDEENVPPRDCERL